MTGYVGASGGRQQITKLWVGTASGNKEVATAWVGTATGNKVWHSAGGATLTTTVLSSTQIRLTAVPTGTVTSYRFYRGSTFLAEQTSPVYEVSGLMANTSYTFKVEAFYSGMLLSTATASATTQAARYQTTTVTLTAADWATYTGAGARRTDADGVANLYYGYYSDLYGLQKSQFFVHVPVGLPGCPAVNKVEVSIYNWYAVDSSKRLDLAVHSQNVLRDTYYRGSDQFAWLTRASPGWVGGVEWLDVTGMNVPDLGVTVAEAFRTRNARGFELRSANDHTSTSYYGYVRPATHTPKVRLTYQKRMN